MDFLADLLATLNETISIWGFSFALMTALELLLPRDPYSAGGRVKGVLFWAIWFTISAVVYAGFRAVWPALGIKPLVVLPVGSAWAGPLALVVAPLLAAVVYDFFFYWCHRAQHRWLWRYHAVHHSIREMSAVNAFHHISEPLVQVLLITVPFSLVTVEAATAIPAVLVLLHLQLSFIHSSTRLHFGPLRAVLVDNHFHRIHHSVEQKHFDHNFGAMTTIWDRLFGTAWMPAKDEWPETGIAEVDQPRTLRDWIMLPADYTAATRRSGEEHGAAPQAI